MGSRGPAPRVLTDAQRRRLALAERRILEARLAWASLIREYGIGAVARDRQISTSAMAETVRRIESQA